MVKKNALFLAIVGLVFLFYSYLSIPITRPISLHTWRQCDGASIALNYYQNDMNFFHPEVNNNLEDNHGYAVEELPWLYYFMAILYKIFGVHEIFFRITVMLIFVLGLYALFRLGLLLLEDTFFSLLVSLFAFSFPVISYYAYNYLPNIPALALDWMGLYHFVRFYKFEKRKDLIWFTLIYAFCGLTKVSSLITFIAIGCAFVWTFIRRSQPSVFSSNRLAWIISFCFVILINLGWYLWANHYNTIHPNGLFLIGILPIWQMTWEQISYTWQQFIQRWYFHFAFPLYYLLLLAALIYIITKRKQLPYLLKKILWFWIIGFFLYIALFFDTFAGHDYYTLCLFTLPVLILLLLFYLLNQNHSRLYLNKKWKAGWALTIGLGIIFTRVILTKEYYDKELIQTNPHLYDEQVMNYIHADLHIQYPQQVVVLPDFSPNVALYLMNLRGWTNFPQDPEQPLDIQRFIPRASYLIVLDSAYGQKDWVKKFTNYPVGNKNGVYVYDLRPYDQH